MPRINISSKSREEFIDITSEVQGLVDQHNIREGACLLHCRHTTAGLTINENADPDVKRDLLMALGRIVKDEWPYRHAEGNSPAHMKSSLLGCSLLVPISGGQLGLGTWQGILFAEFDGPRPGRTVDVHFLN